jgi:hypothetical protein
MVPWPARSSLIATRQLSELRVGVQIAVGLATAVTAASLNARCGALAIITTLLHTHARISSDPVLKKTSASF